MKLWTVKGMILCDEHVSVATDIHHAAMELEAADVDQVWRDAGAPADMYKLCEMCQTPFVPGQCCAYEECKKPLHPRWPAVYCSNQCALRDSR